VCPAGDGVRPKDSPTSEISRLNVTNDEQHKENCAANQFFSSLLGISADPADRGKIIVNVQCGNVGEVLTVVNDCGAQVFVYDGNADTFAKDRVQQERYFKTFFAEYKQTAATFPKKLMPKAYIWFSSAGPSATPQFMTDLREDKKTIVIVGRVLYKDDYTNRTTELCEFVRPPVTFGAPAWAGCLVHTTDK
jgi:hypothetical protein